MSEKKERSIDITGAFVGHVTTDNDSRALNMRTSLTVDNAAGRITTEYVSMVRPGARITNNHTDPRVRRAIAHEAQCQLQMVAADAYRMKPVTPFPKPQRPVIPTIVCPTCDGRKRFAGEPCPECLGRGIVPVRD